MTVTINAPAFCGMSVMEVMTTVPFNKTYSFGNWIVKADGLLLQGSQEFHLPPKELHVLRVLLASSGALVSKERLLEQVWPRCDIAEESLTRCIYTLRKFLGRKSNYIKTVYGKGYRFLEKVSIRSEPSPELTAIPSLLVLPFNIQEEGVQDFHGDVIRQLAAAFPESLCVLSAGLIADASGAGDYFSMVERMEPDYYLCIRGAARNDLLELSVELVRGGDHGVLYSAPLIKTSDRGVVMQGLISLVAQKLPGLRPIVQPCSSYPVAHAYLNGLLGLQAYTADGLGEATVEFLHCLQLDAGYVPPWCGLVDAYVAMAHLGLLAHEEALPKAQKAAARALAIDPESELATVRVALLTSLRGAFDAAEILFRHLLRCGAKFAEIHYCYAWHQFCQGRLDEAMQSIELYLEEDPASIAAVLLRARIDLALNPGRGLAAIMTATCAHEQIDGMQALLLDACGDSVAALNVLQRAGLLGVETGELGLTICYVLAATDPIEARQRYQRWQVASEYPSLCPAQLPVLRRLDGDFYAAKLWHELERRATSWQRMQLRDPRLFGLEHLLDGRLQA